MTDEQKQMDGVEEKPHGRSSRGYRILTFDPSDPTNASDWGETPGTTPQSAILYKRAEDPDLKTTLAEGAWVAAVPAAHFNLLRLTVETVERESFEPVE